MEKDLLKGQLVKLIELKDKTSLKQIASNTHAADLAEVIDNVETDNRMELFSVLEKDQASDVLIELSDHAREEILKELNERDLSRLVDEMPSDDAADVIGELSDEKAGKILNLISKEESEDVQELLKYKEDSAGGIMATELVAVKIQATVEEAVNQIRTATEEVENIHVVYVIDNENVLKGTLPLDKLIISNAKLSVEKMMESDYHSVTTNTDQEEVANIMKKYDLVVVPVVSITGKLVGRITFDDILDVLEEEATEDISKMAGTTDEELEEDSFLKISKLRLPWLIVGLFGGFGAALVMSHFEETFNALLTVTFFVPVIMAMGGNVGIQSSAIVVRGLATGEISLAHTGKRLFTEIKVASVNGFICGLVLYLISYFWLHNLNLGLIIGTCLFINIILAATVGATVPLVLKKMNIDPALATGPFITTLNDVLGLFVYLSVITLFLKFL